MPIQALKEELKKAPKVLRTCRHNKHPIVMNPSYFDQFDATPNDTSKLALAKYSIVSNILLVIERAKFCANSTNYSYPSFARLFAGVCEILTDIYRILYDFCRIVADFP